jgi:hypothetical protein
VCHPPLDPKIVIPITEVGFENVAIVSAIGPGTHLSGSDWTLHGGRARLLNHIIVL